MQINLRPSGMSFSSATAIEILTKKKKSTLFMDGPKMWLERTTVAKMCLIYAKIGYRAHDSH